MASDEFQALLATMRSRQAPATPPTREQQRAGLDQLGAGFPIAADDARESVFIGGVSCEWFTAPNAHRGRVILHFHGGGYVNGSSISHGANGGDAQPRRRSESPDAQLPVSSGISLPAAVDDAVATYNDLLGQGFAPANIAFGGDSAGGGLAVAALIAIRDSGQPLPATAFLISPWLDLTCSGETMASKAASDPILQKASLLAMAADYLAGADAASPLASPLFADLTGLPPLLIQVGTAEVLLDDAHRFAARATEAGVAVELQPWEDMVHAWQTVYAAMVPEGQQAIDACGTFIRAKLGHNSNDHYDWQR